MQVQIKDISPLEKRLTIEIPWDVVSQKLKMSYRHLTTRVALPGFRKGKVPVSMLEKMFGAKVRSEVAVELTREFLIQAIQTNELHVVSEPKLDISEIKKDTAFTFEAHVEVAPTVAITSDDYEGLTFEKETITITDAQVEEALDALVQKHVVLAPIEDRDILEASDVVSLSLKGTLGEHDIDRPQLQVDLERASLEPLPGLVNALLGLSISQKDHDISWDIAKDFEDETIAGCTAVFSISISDVRNKKTPELDDEFAKDTGRAETLKELREVLHDDLEQQNQQSGESRMNEKVLDSLVSKINIPLSPSMVDTAFSARMRQFQQMLGLTDEQAQEHSLGDDVESEMRQNIENEIQKQLLIEAIADDASITVSTEELQEHIDKLAQSRNTSSTIIRDELVRNGSLGDVKFSIRKDRVMSLLREKGTIKTVSAISDDNASETQTSS